MFPFQSFYQNPFVFERYWPIIVIVALWEIFWKGRGLWAAARSNNTKWFIAILIINSLGILPIVYLYFFQKKSKKKAA